MNNQKDPMSDINKRIENKDKEDFQKWFSNDYAEMLQAGRSDYEILENCFKAAATPLLEEIERLKVFEKKFNAIKYYAFDALEDSGLFMNPMLTKEQEDKAYEVEYYRVHGLICQNQELKERLKRAKDSEKAWRILYDKIGLENTNLKIRLYECEKVVAFYAEKENWFQDELSPSNWSDCIKPSDVDKETLTGGFYARDYLKKHKQE